MTNELIQGTPEWHALRAKSIGASDAAAIMGVSKWTTPYQLWEQKLGLREVEINSAMKRGTDMEDEARKEFEHLHNVAVFPDVVLSEEYPWAMASLDGISMDRSVIVEIKCVNRFDHQIALEGKVPEHYYPQCQHQMWVTGTFLMYYFSYDPMNPATVIVPRDDVYISDMIEKEKEFYRCIMEFDPPTFTDRDYVEHDDKEWSMLAFELKHTLANIKVFEQREKDLRNQLIQLSEGKNSIGCGIRLTRFIRKGNVEYAKIPALQGVDLEQYRKPPIESWRIGELDG